MSAVAWHAGVPQHAQLGSIAEEPLANVARFEPEVGPPKERRRTLMSVNTLSFSTVMRWSEFDTLLAWYRATLADGVVQVTRKHPRDMAGSDITVKFSAVPKAAEINNTHCRVALQFLRFV